MQLADIVHQSMISAETVYLLTALAHMATCRPPREFDFIQAVSFRLFEVCLFWFLLQRFVLDKSFLICCCIDHSIGSDSKWYPSCNNQHVFSQCRKSKGSIPSYTNCFKNTLVAFFLV